MSNPLERAVIAAARALVEDEGGTPYNDLVDAVRALDAHEAPRSVGWHEVVESDELLSRNGKYYKVLKVIKLTSGYQITVDLAGSPRAIVRPTEAEPSATVRRGPAGLAVDTFVHVFSSGESL